MEREKEVTMDREEEDDGKEKCKRGARVCDDLPSKPPAGRKQERASMTDLVFGLRE